MFKFEYIAYGLLAVTALIVIIDLVRGVVRGLKKSLASLAVVITSVIISTIVTMLVCTPKSALIVMLMDFVRNNIELGELFGIAEIGEALAYYVSMILSPFFFLIVYFMVSIIVGIVGAIVIKHIPPKVDKKDAKSRLAGMGVGAACGLLVAIVTLMPLVGVLDIAASAGEVLLADAEDDPAEAADNDLAGIVKDASENTVLKVYSGASGWLFDTLASSRFEGETVYLRHDVSTVLAIVPQLSGISEEMSSFDREKIDALDSLVDALDSSALLKHTVSGIVSEAAGHWSNDEPFMGMDMIDAGELLDPMVGSMVEVFATTTKDTVSSDLRTVTGVFGVLVDHEMLSRLDDTEHMLSTLGEDGVIKDLILVINRNERMSVVSDEITRLSVRALAVTLNIPKDADELYHDITADLALAINDSRYNGENRRYILAENICDTFVSHGIELENEQALTLADSMLLDLGNVSDLQGDTVEEFFLVYSAAAPDKDVLYTGGGTPVTTVSSVTMITVNPDGTISVGDRVLKTYNAANYGKSAAYQLGQSGADIGDAYYLYSAKKTAEHSSIVTLDVILSHVNSYGDCSDPDMEAQSISDMFATAAELFAGGGLENKSYDELIADMGTLLDKMRHTEVFGQQAISDVMKAILQSDKVKDEMGLTATEASNFSDKLNNLVNDDYSYADATGTVSSTITMINSVKDENITKEERRENTQKLIEDLDPDKADMLSAMVTPSSMIKYGSSEEKAHSVSNSVSTLFNNMANFNAEPGSDAYRHEADAVNTVLDLAMKGSDDEDDRRLFGEGEGKLDTSAADFVHLIVNSEVVSSTIITASAEGEENPYGVYPSDEDRVELSAAMENYYAENSEGKTAEELAELQARLNALAVVTDMPVMFPAA